MSCKKWQSLCFTSTSICRKVYWIWLSKWCVWIFTEHNIESFRQVREAEISCLIHPLFESCEHETSPVNMKIRLPDLTCNILMQVVASKMKFSLDFSHEYFEKALHLKNLLKILFRWWECLIWLITLYFLSGPIHRE